MGKGALINKDHKMKKTLLAIGVASLAFAALASAATFSNNLTVGSTGADVSALQTWLIAQGYSIPAIQSGAAAPGYFGSQTKAAVVAYQIKVGLPSFGFFGPLTQAKVNAGVTGMAGNGSIASNCLTGWTAITYNGTSACLPPGYAVPAGSTPVISTPGTIGTPGIPGTLSASLWSTPSGVNVYKGQSYDVAGYKLQAGASDMAVSSLTLDFSDRLWLYANTITVKDETGAVIGTVSGLNASNFVELTVGSDYRVSVPVSNLVVKATQSKYLTVSIGFNAVSDRCSGGPCSLIVTQAQVRSVDGTGVTDTETVTAGRSFTYNGSTTGQIFVTTDQNQPPTQLVQLSTAVQTQNVLLGIFDIKSANEPSTLQTLAIGINSNGKATISSLFGNIQIKVAGLTYSAAGICTDNTTVGVGYTCVGTNSTSASSTIIFNNMTIPLAADTYTPVSVYVTLQPDNTGSLNGAAASTTLTAFGLAGGTNNNPAVVDATYNNLVVSYAKITNNDQTFVDAGVTVSNLPALPVYGTKTCDQTNATCNETFTISYSLTAGNNAIYVSTAAATAVSNTTTGSLSYTLKTFSDNNTNGDTANYFYVAPGQSKTFNLIETAVGPAAGGTFGVTSLNYGTVSTGPYTIQLTNSSITTALKAVLF
jgi:peptidoglycan hydrolase-like protein with peptidoglycan-binding domain